MTRAEELDHSNVRVLVEAHTAERERREKQLAGDKDSEVKN